MKFDTQPLLLAAARFVMEGHLEAQVLTELRAGIVKLEGQLALKQGHVEAYEEARARLVLDGSALSWNRWRTENLLLIFARAEVERTQSQLRLEVERLETEVALAQQKKARALAKETGVLA